MFRLSRERCSPVQINFNVYSYRSPPRDWRRHVCFENISKDHRHILFRNGNQEVSLKTAANRTGSQCCDRYSPNVERTVSSEVKYHQRDVMEADVRAAGSSKAFTEAMYDLGKQLLEKARKGETAEVRQLMANGAPFIVDWLGTSPLHMAAASGHRETCEVLLKAGCIRDARTKVDKTALHLAAYEGHNDVVLLLIKYGASIEARDMLRMTPLHWAVEKGHIDVIKTLLQNGASLDITSKFDLSPMDIALQNERQEIVEILQESLVSPAAVNNAVASIYSPPHSTNSAPRESPVTITVGHKVYRPFVTKKGRLHSERQVGSSRSKDPTLSALDALEEAAGNAHVSEDALRYLQAQGINVHDSALQDDGSIVTSALETGQTISLSDAGRLALKGDLGTDKIIIVNSTEEDDRLSLQRQLEETRREAERYKKALREKEEENEEYKKRLKLV